jgi:hypothetical protein
VALEGGVDIEGEGAHETGPVLEEFSFRRVRSASNRVQYYPFRKNKSARSAHFTSSSIPGHSTLQFTER